MRPQTKRTIAGRFFDGARGFGYAVTRNGAGDYTVRFNPPLRGPVGVSVIWEGAVGSGTYTTMIYGTPNGDGFNVRLYSSGALTDGSGYFVAAGEQ